MIFVIVLFQGCVRPVMYFAFGVDATGLAGGARRRGVPPAGVALLGGSALFRADESHSKGTRKVQVSYLPI